MILPLIVNRLSRIIKTTTDFGDSWTVSWRWMSILLVNLRNRVSCYNKNITGKMIEEFEKEVDRWIEDEILVPWNDKVEVIILLMAVELPTKNKVRPVLEFRELNQFVECHTGDDVIDNCEETLRE